MLRFLRGRFRKKGGERHVIVHNHLFKNAGTTVDGILRKNFGSRFVDHRDNKAMRKGSAYLGEFFRNNPHVSALASHHLALPLPQIANTAFYLLTMYRHPLDRVASAYNFERAQVDSGTQGSRFAREHSLREYVLWRMRRDVPPTIRNASIMHSLPFPHRWDRTITRADLETAKEFVAGLPLLGIVECFDESMVLFGETLRPVFPGIDFSYVRRNVRQANGLSPVERIARLREEIGQDAFDLLCECNALDIELYEYAVSTLRRRMSATPGFDATLHAFVASQGEERNAQRAGKVDALLRKDWDTRKEEGADV